MRADVVAWKRALVTSELPAAEHHVAVALTLWMARDGGFNGTPPAASTIATACGRKRGTVLEALDSLARKGWLVVAKRPGKPSLLHAAIPDRLFVDPFAVLDGEPDPSPNGYTPPENLYPERDRYVYPDGYRYPYPDRYTSPGPVPGGVQVVYPDRYTNPYPVSNTTTTESRTRAGNDSQQGGEAIESKTMQTPDMRPDLWDQAGRITEQATHVTNPTGYRLAVFRRLLTEETTKTQAADTQATINQCNQCGPSGMRVVEVDGYDVATRCNHE